MFDRNDEETTAPHATPSSDGPSDFACYVSVNGDASELVCSWNVPRSNPRDIDRRPPRRLVGSVMDARRSESFEALSQVLTTPRRSRGRAVQAVLPMLGLTIAKLISPPHDF
jgi:hypothetical protein